MICISIVTTNEEHVYNPKLNESVHLLAYPKWLWRVPLALALRLLGQSPTRGWRNCPRPKPPRDAEVQAPARRLQERAGREVQPGHTCSASNNALPGC